jgi:hypothetical protein
MITPFRLIKNKTLREDNCYEDYFRSLFLQVSIYLENKILNLYNISNNDIKRDRLNNINLFLDDFLKSETAESFLKERIDISINKYNRMVFNGGEFEIIYFIGFKYLNSLNYLKENSTKKNLLLCFNLTPIREPNIFNSTYDR